MPNHHPPIQTLSELLTALQPIKAGAVDSFSRVLSSTRLSRESIQKYIFFRKEGYTRNLVVRTEQYELLVLCWDIGQYSPIHNHQSQDCWMYVVDGILAETLYSVSETAQHRVHLQQIRKTQSDPGGFFYINDGMGLHRVSNGGAVPAISLHLYSFPFDTCNIYSEETGEVTQRVLQYYSVDGKKLEAVGRS